jgi:hypothetical protein
MMDESKQRSPRRAGHHRGRREGIAQAGALRAQATKGGLVFAAYLPPRLAEWLLDLIERGEFADPSEAVFVILGEHRELEPHADLRDQFLRRSCQAESDDPRSFGGGTVAGVGRYTTAGSGGVAETL